MGVLTVLFQSLFAAAGMFWSILWALVFGFGLSACVMAFIPKQKIVKALGQPSARSISLATFLGGVSSSCSYSATSMARSLFQKGAHIIPSLAFMLASTNLVIELSAVLWIMMGWQFVVAEFLGGLLLVFIMSNLVFFFAPLKEISARREELNREGPDDESHHGSSDEVADPRTLAGWVQAAHSFVSEWQMIWKDIVLGLVIAGFLMVIVPDSFWQTLFLQTGDSSRFNFFQVLENALIGPLVSMVSFVCSVGNIPLAGVLYHGGITFGGALSFIYGDLIIIPLILIYKKYYGTRIALWITGIFYVSMVIAGIIVDLLFHLLNIIPARHAMMPMKELTFFSWNYTTWLNLIALGIGGIFFWLSKKESPAESPHCCH